METSNGSGAVPPDAQSLNDIHNYLENFNKEISDPSSQTYIITTNTDGNYPGGGQQIMTIGEAGAPPVLQSEGQGNRVGNNGETDAPTLQAEIPMVDAVAPQVDIDQPLLTPAAPTLTGQQDAEMTPQMLQQGMQQEALDSSDTAVQMLASVAATSIPQAQPEVAVRQGNTQMVAIQNDQDSSQPQIVEAQMDGQEQHAGGMQADVANSLGLQQKEGDGNAYQTVTIIPSAVAQGGEVSYVLIVSHPDGEQEKDGDENVDMSVYDFKEEVKGVGNVQAEVEEEDDDEDAEDDGTQRKLMRLSPKKGHVMQAQLMCNYCNYTSPKRYLLTRHMKTHSEERPHKCNICDRCFKTIASLQNHINTHTGVRPHKCKECDSAFTTSGELVRHVRYRHTYEKPHKCPECDYSSVELSKLKRHIRSHTGERPYQCPHCTYASPDTYKLKRHLRIHTGEKPYECEICHARFTQSNSLKAHKLIHTGNKPVFQCELCPTTCGRKTDLKIHVQKLHTSDQPLQCKKCGKSFPDRYTYKIHVKTHEGEKCFKCELCPYAALSQRHLESHILTHTGEKPFQCDECEQSFRQKQLLRRHKNLYHTPDYIPPVPRDKRHRCQECPKSFAHHGNLLRHMQLHDPDNPDYHVKGEGYSEEEEEEEEDDEDMLDEGHTVIQEGQPPQQVQVLMTEDGEHATQILLQVVPHMGQNAHQGEIPVQMAVETPGGEQKVGIMVIQQDEQQQQEVVTVAQIPASPRRSSRMLQPKMEKLEDDESGSLKRPADEQELLMTPAKRIKKLEMSNPEDVEEERRREEQKRKDIETCFGFDMEEGEQVAQ